MTRMTSAILFLTVLSGPALAQGDPQFCARYAANVAGIGDLAIKKNPACLDYSRGVHGVYNSHFDWCMKNPRASVEGAEANIRRLVGLCTGNAAAPVRPAPERAAAPTQGAQEPFGPNIGSWQFTQQPHRTKVFCRAIFGSTVIGRFGDGQYRVSFPYDGPKGKFEGANIGIGSYNGPVNVNADGRRLNLPTDDYEIDLIVKAGGFSWSAWNRQGDVRFDKSVGAAVARLKECTKANGGT